MARVVAAIANGGIIYKPYIVAKVESPAGEILYQAKPEVQSRLGASPANLEAVRQALVGVVNEGTAKVARLPNIQVAGKTGTSQVVALDPDNPKKKRERLMEDHAWFVAYAPADDPQRGRGGLGGTRRPRRRRRRPPGPAGYCRGPGRTPGGPGQINLMGVVMAVLRMRPEGSME